MSVIQRFPIANAAPSATNSLKEPAYVLEQLQLT